MISNMTVDKALDEKYKGKILFPEKHNKVIEHFKDRNSHQEIKEISERERITKP